jgi:hypothetical protein
MEALELPVILPALESLMLEGAVVVMILDQEIQHPQKEV